MTGRWQYEIDAPSSANTLRNPGAPAYFTDQFSGNTRATISRFGQQQIIGLPNYANNNPLKLFPNPEDNVVYINFEKLECDACSVAVFDLTGRICHMMKIENSVSQNYINISTLVPGLYILNLNTNGEVYSAKFIKL